MAHFVTSSRMGLAVLGVTFGLPALLLAPTLIEHQPTPANTSNGVRLAQAYQDWQDSFKDQGRDSTLRLRFGWLPGISAATSQGKGHIDIDLKSGQAELQVQNLPADTQYDAWLVDNTDSPTGTVAPESGDQFLHLGRIDAATPLVNRIEAEQLKTFEIDMVVITPAGQRPDQQVLLAGTPTLFQRMYTRKQLGLPEYASPAATQALPGLGNAVAENPLGSLDALISSGANLFMNGTFNGNGRTCASCHRAENNFTIDPAFIATLPADDPLFVAEFNPDLASNFENPALMRRFGLIVENVDGTDDLANKFTMRSVPHTLGMSVSLTPAPGGTDGTSIPPEQRTGWSGDGAPGAGTLRDFATGAVTQHFTRTLARQAGSDFRLPTDAELDAMEAFQLALGRQEDLDLSTLQLSDPVAARGQLLFTQSDSGGGSQGAGKCNVCHANAGANAAFAPANFNFDTGIEAMPDQPARLVDANINSDGGFGKDPHPATPGAFGDGSFNTPPLVEAADTAPYFHNNSVGTLEEAVGFYNSAAFANSPSGQFLASIDSGGVGIQLEPTQVEAIAAFLRTINAMENIRSSTDTAITAKSAANDAGADSLILLMEADIEDAIQVLSARGLSANAVSHLQAALELSADARAQSGLSCRFFLCLPSNGPRNALLNDVIAELNAADAIMRL